MSKEYSPQLMAVDAVSFDVFQGVTTVLLDTVGDGKTTIISMVTGITEPTKGSTLINGFNILQMQDVRGTVGVCLQKNIISRS